MYEITSFSANHVPDLIDALTSLSAIDPLYPPRAVVVAGETAKWLLQYPSLYRAVALVDGKAVGHVQIVPTMNENGIKTLRSVGVDAYFSENKQVHKMFEIARLFVGTQYHGKGLGKLLLENAVEYLENKDLIPVLCVEETQTHATALYDKSGWQLCGTFENRLGTNVKVYSYRKMYSNKADKM